jgi:hypothetical protein
VLSREELGDGSLAALGSACLVALGWAGLVPLPALLCSRAVDKWFDKWWVHCHSTLALTASPPPQLPPSFLPPPGTGMSSSRVWAELGAKTLCRASRVSRASRPKRTSTTRVTAHWYLRTRACHRHMCSRQHARSCLIHALKRTWFKTSMKQLPCALCFITHTPRYPAQQGLEIGGLVPLTEE